MRYSLKTIEDSGFCRLYSFQELFAVKLQKRNLVFILPFGIKDFGRWRIFCVCHGRMCNNETEYITSCVARLFVAKQAIETSLSVHARGAKVPSDPAFRGLWRLTSSFVLSTNRFHWVFRMKPLWRVYWRVLETEEKALLALLPTRRIV